MEDEVSIKVSLEVSSIVREITTSTGLLAYQVGSRQAGTVLRLRDGETQILAGLLNDEERQTGNRIPGLGELPIIGRLFGSERDDRQKTEIVLSITPRLVRSLTRPAANLSEFWSGTEVSLRTRPLAVDSAMSEAGKTNSFPRDKGSAHSRTSRGSLTLAGPRSVRLGDEFMVDIVISADEPLRSLPLQLEFDRTALEIVRVDPGSVDSASSAMSSISINVDPTTGRAFIGVTQLPPSPLKADKVAAVTFRAIAERSNVVIRALSAYGIATSGGLLSIELPPTRSLTIQK